MTVKCVCVCTSEEHALTEITAHIIHADSLNPKQIQNIRRHWRNDSLLGRRHNQYFQSVGAWCCRLGRFVIQILVYMTLSLFWSKCIKQVEICFEFCKERWLNCKTWKALCECVNLFYKDTFLIIPKLTEVYYCQIICAYKCLYWPTLPVAAGIY